MGDKYDVIAADPPWEFESTKGGGNKRDVSRQYPPMTVDEIKQLDPFVNTHAEPICRLFLWVVDSQLQAGIDVMRAWGFKPVKVVFVWVKLTKAELKGKALERAREAGDVVVYSKRHGHRRLAFGAGRTTRNGAELCLLGSRGPMRVGDKSQRQVIQAPQRAHSQKPEEFFERVEALYPDARRLELFARQRRVRWDTWGNEL